MRVATPDIVAPRRRSYHDFKHLLYYFLFQFHLNFTTPLTTIWPNPRPLNSLKYNRFPAQSPIGDGLASKWAHSGGEISISVDRKAVSVISHVSRAAGFDGIVNSIR